MAQKIKSIKDLKKLPSGNFLDTTTRIVWSKAIIEEEFAEELTTIKDVEKVVEKPKVVAKAKLKSKAKK